ncbi:MAG: phosphoserine phosphatase SerB [Alphaproteobacteria bacterium]|nr:phosphoserine phosphatase SerB [Alphaproteobacteria bacterium]
MRFSSPAEGIESLKQQAAAIVGKHPVDVNILPDDGPERRKKLLIADMDSTIIEQECIDEIADFAGVREKVSGITERAMRGELDFADALRERAGLLKGLSVDVLDEIIDKHLTIMPGAKALVATMKANGATTALVSGGFTHFTQQIASLVGFEHNQANQLTITDDHLAGTVGDPILGKQAKLDALNHYALQKGIPLSATLAVGDGANDLAMIRAAGLGVAYRAKPIVAVEAKASIKHGNLRALLYLQGYTEAEIVV